MTLYDENDLESEYSIKADSRDIHGYVGDNPLLINNDDIYVNVLKEAKEPNSGTVSFDYQDPLQYEEIGDEILFRVNPTDYNDEDENVLGNPLGDGLLVVSQIERPLSIEALQYESETDIYGQSSTRNIYYSYVESPLTENDGFHIKGVMARGHRDDGSWDGSVPNSPTVEQNSMWGDFEYPAPDSFIFDRGLFGCFIKMPTFASFSESQGFILSNFWSSFYNRNYIGEGTSGVNYRIRFGGASSGDYPSDAPYQDNGGENTQTGAGTEASPNGLPNSGTTHNSLTGGDNAIKIDFVDKLHFHMSQHSGSYAVAVGQVEFFNHIEVHNQGLIKDFIKQDFYANVKGRVNTFDDHPKLSNFYTIDELIGLMLDWEASFYEGSINTIQDEFDSLYEDLVAIQEQDDPDYFPEGFIDIIINDVLVLLGDESTFIQNPIDIIYDLVRSEIGHDNIDEAEYIEARNAHANWKFAFTVNNKISSKKLIEDIAKSTKCFPKFKNDGSFGFNTIKDSYTYEGDNSDYTGATLIKESEVISYSFKKTKPEQIHRKVTVAYHKDYAQDSYLKNLDMGGDLQNFYGNDYYGITDTGETVLEFESDYIRAEEDYDWTAFYLRNFLLQQYKNDHLIFKLKLPLQYINLEIGDLVKFESLFQGVKAYGIDYRICEEVNHQFRYPLFMVTSTQKNLDSVSIECMQLHHLDTVAPVDWNDLNNSFPDADTVIIEPYLFAPDVVTTEFEETDDSVETDNLFIHRQPAGLFMSSDIYWLYNKDLEGFDFTEYDGGVDEQNIFSLYNKIQIKNATDAIIVNINGVYNTENWIGAQRLRIFRTDYLSNPLTPEEESEFFESFFKPEGWDETQSLQTLEITRVTETAITPLSSAFDDKVKDLSKIKDITIW